MVNILDEVRHKIKPNMEFDYDELEKKVSLTITYVTEDEYIKLCNVLDELIVALLKNDYYVFHSTTTNKYICNDMMFYRYVSLKLRTGEENVEINNEQ